jgi:hypothetical protein
MSSARRRGIATLTLLAPGGFGGVAGHSGSHAAGYTHFINYSWSAVTNATGYEFSNNGGSTWSPIGNVLTHQETTTTLFGTGFQAQVRATAASGATKGTTSGNLFVAFDTVLDVLYVNYNNGTFGIGSGGTNSGIAANGDLSGGNGAAACHNSQFPSLAFDNNAGTFWQAFETQAATQNRAWVGVDMGSPIQVEGFSINQTAASGTSEYVTLAGLYFSDDGANWTHVVSAPGIGPSQSGISSVPISTISAHRFWKVQAESTLATNGNWRVSEITFYKWQ